MRLVKLAIVQGIGSVEDERTLFTFFYEVQVTERLARHLNIVIHMFAHEFYTKETFPFHQAITH
jgi:hypothetical protein